MLVLFIIFFHTFFGPGENYIIIPLFPASFPVFGGMGSLKWEGFILGLIVINRLIAIMILFPVFTETTPAHKIAAGLCSLGINYRYAFIITTAFNLVPVFREDALVIMEAQKLRGMRSFEEGSFFSKLQTYPHLVLPLVLGAMRKAQLSSIAMDSRAYGIYKTRTWLDKPKMNYYDFFCITGCLIFFVSILIINYLPGFFLSGF
jgi:energy-coupling factor transport system permease protein